MFLNYLPDLTKGLEIPRAITRSISLERGLQASKPLRTLCYTSENAFTWSPSVEPVDQERLKIWRKKLCVLFHSELRPLAISQAGPHLREGANAPL